jgi:hypothetical protein
MQDGEWQTFSRRNGARNGHGGGESIQVLNQLSLPLTYVSLRLRLYCSQEFRLSLRCHHHHHHHYYY